MVVGGCSPSLSTPSVRTWPGSHRVAAGDTLTADRPVVFPEHRTIAAGVVVQLDIEAEIFDRSLRVGELHSDDLRHNCGRVLRRWRRMFGRSRLTFLADTQGDGGSVAGRPARREILTGDEPVPLDEHHAILTSDVDGLDIEPDGVEFVFRIQQRHSDDVGYDVAGSAAAHLVVARGQKDAGQGGSYHCTESLSEHGRPLYGIAQGTRPGIPPLDPPAHALRRQPRLEGLPVKESAVDSRRWCRDLPAGAVGPVHRPMLEREEIHGWTHNLHDVTSRGSGWRPGPSPRGCSPVLDRPRTDSAARSRDVMYRR